uniref:Uncharacterized protein n=1 Tax=Theileria parva TaxID=5875 RepID=Q4MZM4_THEPA|eukprot:XP_763520.1 hypothetical protein [Theileria parva strain Muguga]
MEGQISEIDEIWLSNFRKKLSSSKNTLEFAKKALFYDPYHLNLDEEDYFKISQDNFRISEDNLRSSSLKCSGIKLLDVSSVFEIGKNSLIWSSNVKANLQKIETVLTETLNVLKKNTSEGQEHRKKLLKQLENLCKKFKEYEKICLELLEVVKYTPKKVKEVENLNVLEQFSEITSKFKVSQEDLQIDTKLPGETEPETHLSTDLQYLTLVWSFYRESSCSEIFSLMCYTLFTGNITAFKSILHNSNTSCMLSHIKENWKVLLSYIPISFQFNHYILPIQCVISNPVDTGHVDTSGELSAGGELVTGEVNLDVRMLVDFIDWCFWRIFLILKYTNSSYFILSKFLKSLFKLLEPVDSGLDSLLSRKLHLLNFLKFIIKQYFLYKYINSKHINSIVDRVSIMTFFEYLELDASKKLNLFCEFDLSLPNEQCNCEDQFRDKHKIYKFCLACKTNRLCQKLKAFFILISPSNTVTNSNTVNNSNPVTNSSPVTNANTVNTSNTVNNSNTVTTIDAVNSDQLCGKVWNENGDFREFYESLLRSYNSDLNDYIIGVSETFMKELSTNSFEILYSLSKVLLETSFKDKVYKIFISITFRENAKYNFLDNYFIINSIFSLIIGEQDNYHQDTVDTIDVKNTLFKFLKFFKLSNFNPNNYSTYKLLLTQINSLYTLDRELDIAADSGVDTQDTEFDTWNTKFDTRNTKLCVQLDGINLRIVNSVIKCIFDFVEGLLNLFAINNVENFSVLVITPLDLVLALVDQEYFLLLLQKIISFLVDVLEPQEFYNAMCELVNLSNYISNTQLNDILNMFFYTISISDNLNYINYLLDLHLGQGSPGDSLDNTTVLNSLESILNIVYRIDLSCNLNVFNVVSSYYKFVPKNNKFYSVMRHKNPFSIYSLITLFLNYLYSNTALDSVLLKDNFTFSLNYCGTLGGNVDGNVHGTVGGSVGGSVGAVGTEGFGKGFGKGFDLILESLEFLIMLSKIYKSMLMFNHFSLSTGKQHVKLDYKLYEPAELISNTLSSLILLTGDKRNVNSSQVILTLVFKSILYHVLGSKSFTNQVFDNLKTLTLDLIPKPTSDTVLSILNLLNNTVILSVEMSNLMMISSILQFCLKAQLSQLMSFITLNLVYSNFKGLDSTHPDVDSSDKLDPHCDKIGLADLFEDSDVTYSNSLVDDWDLRKNILMLLFFREEKGLVKGSMVKLADNLSHNLASKLSHNVASKLSHNVASKLAHNVASEFITAAIEKAEGELINIAKKTNRFDMIKEKFLYHKKTETFENSMFPPVLDYFESTPLFHPNLLYNSGDSCGDSSIDSEMFEYRNLREITVSGLVSLDVNLASLMLMENCNFQFNSQFLKDIREVFAKNDMRHVSLFLDSLLVHFRHCKWPENVISKIETVNEFLKLFKHFPRDFSVLVTPFIFKPEYRFELFKNIPEFVQNNVKPLYYIYVNLSKFNTQSNSSMGFGNTFVSANVVDGMSKITEDKLSGCELNEYLFGKIGNSDNLAGNTTDNLVNNLNSEDMTFLCVNSFPHMAEYVEILFNAYDQVFLEDFNVALFIELEPLFLLNHERFANFLIKLYTKLVVPFVSTSRSSQSINTPSTNKFASPRTPVLAPSNPSLLLNNRFLMLRRSICNLLSVYPEYKEVFSTLYMPDSGDVIKMLESILRHMPDFDLTLVDNFEFFKQNLVNSLTLDNFFFVSDSISKLDPAFIISAYRKLELKLRPHSDQLVDCTRLLFEFDLSNNTL